MGGGGSRSSSWVLHRRGVGGYKRALRAESVRVVLILVTCPVTHATLGAGGGGRGGAAAAWWTWMLLACGCGYGCGCSSCGRCCSCSS